MTPKEFVVALRQMNAQMQNFLRGQGRTDAPAIVGKTAKDFFTENFVRQGFLDSDVEKWKDVKRRSAAANMKTIMRGVRKGETVAKNAAGRNPILVGSGNLKRSIQFSTRPDGAAVYSDSPYAEAHNEGTNTAGRNHNVHIPKRQFIGESNALNDIITKELERKMEGILNRQ